MAMAHSVEGRFPFLDYRVAEFAATLPPRLKMHGLNEKYLLKRAFRDVVPQQVVQHEVGAGRCGEGNHEIDCAKTEHERADHAAEVAQRHENAKETHDNIQNAEGLLKLKTQALKRNRLEIQHAEQDKTKVVTHQTKLDLQCQELHEQVQLGQETLQRNQKELEQLQEHIAEAQEQLVQKDSELKQASQALQAKLQERDQATRQADALYAKQGRGKEYKSKEERDRSLQKQIRKLEGQQTQK